MVTFDAVRDIILDELRAKGYNPNPADILGAVTKIVSLARVKEEDVEVKAAPANPPVVLPPKL